MQLHTPTIDETAFIAATAQIYGDVVIGPDVLVMFGAVLRAELDRISVGQESNIQDNAVLHSDEGVPCAIGARVTVGHGAVVHGASIGDHCLVGIRSAALNGATLGEGAWLAAGSVLPEGKEIPPWTLAVGSPAKPIRELTEAEVARQRDGIDTYRQFAALYRAAGADRP